MMEAWLNAPQAGAQGTDLPVWLSDGEHPPSQDKREQL